MARGKILRCFLNVDLRNGHDGLTKLAKENGISTKEIDVGSYIIFVNSAKTKLKLYAADQVIAYLRLPQGQVINMNVIRELPKVFNGSRIDYDTALKTAIENALTRKLESLTVVG